MFSSSLIRNGLYHFRIGLPIASVTNGNGFNQKRSISSKSNAVPRESYWHEPSSKLLHNSLNDVLTATTERYPDSEALIFHQPKIKFTYEQFKEKTDQLAAGLVSLGCNIGDKVGVWAPNVPDWPICQFATATAGLVQVNLNPVYSPSELQFALNHSETKVLIMVKNAGPLSFLDKLYSLLPELETMEKDNVEISSEKLPFLKHVLLLDEEKINGTLLISEVYRAGETKENMKKMLEQKSKVDVDGPINIQYTSGTTGTPKGVVLSQFNIVNNAQQCSRGFGLSNDSRLCNPLPLFHCFGMTCGSVGNVVLGGTSIYPYPFPNATANVEAIRDYKCTAMFGTPTMFLDTTHHELFTKENTESLRLGVSGGAACSPEMAKSFQKKGIDHMTIGYGLTEASPVVSFVGIDADPKLWITSIGKPLGNVEVKVVDGNNLTVPLGESGEICTRGHNVMLEYFKEPEKTAEVLSKDRWLRTGDLGKMDENGYLFITGRAKEIIIRGGENIYPREVENIMHEHPAVEDAHVFGVHDDRLGEVPAAWIRLELGYKKSDTLKQQIFDHCKNKLAYFKIPKYVKVVTDYPLTQTGKVKKYIMKDLFEQELGLKK
ncbi:hypothetical protein SNEBB_000098 [Seison nebaliae]|nr:hypothetical protein SNEBB_000098 [Seison nebaliae]